MNEPVAYIDPYDLERLPHYDCHIGSQQLKNGIPLYTQDQLEEARKLGMQQERALWNLSASTQEIMDTNPVKEQDESFDRTASHMAGEYVSWTSCVACGQRVTGDSIHTCSPQLKEQDTDCQYCKQGCIRCDARKQLTDEEISQVYKEVSEPFGEKRLYEIHDFARAILRKASEK